MDQAPRLKITEIFYSLQGESSWMGRPCVFIRLTGCHLRCTWCDTEYSFHGGQWMTLPELLDKVRSYGCPLVEVTGGEPLLQDNVHPLMTALCDAGYTVLLETSGAIDADPVDERVRRIIDVKCPGSNEEARNFWTNLAKMRPTDEFKFVVADRTDYEYAREVIRRYKLETRSLPPLISPVHSQVAMTDLAAWMLEDKLQARLQFQLHKLIWGAEATGV